MASIKEVAELAGVSIATVSRFINNPDQVKSKTGQKVEQAIQATGYSPNALAQNFRRGKTHQVVVVVPSIGVPFFEGVMDGIRRIAIDRGYEIVVKETRYNTLEFNDFTRMVFSKQADGIILLSAFSPFAEPNNSFKNSHPPIVLSLENAAEELKHFPSVRIDNIAAAKDATQYLLDLGHKDIAFIYGRPHKESTITQYREEGFRMAMEHAELTVEPSWVIDGKMTIEGSRQATRQLLHYGDKRPTAIFCANDEMAMAAMHEIKQAGLSVPKDISVIGFDDIRFTEITDPPLTTVAQPAVEIGERTMHRLCEAIEGKDIGFAAEIVPHKLVVRKSTAPPT